MISTSFHKWQSGCDADGVEGWTSCFQVSHLIVPIKNNVFKCIRTHSQYPAITNWNSATREKNKHFLQAYLQPSFITPIHHRPAPPQPWTPRGPGRGLGPAFIISAWTAALEATAARRAAGAWWTPVEEGWASRSRATPGGPRIMEVAATRRTSSSTTRGATCLRGRSAIQRTEHTGTPGPVSWH